MKRLTLIIAFFLITSAFYVNAKIDVDLVNEEYGIDEDIVTRVKITSEMDIQALFSTEINCEEFQKIYFIRPINLEKNKILTIDIPPIKAFDRMLGNCVIDFYLNSLIGAEIEKTWTENFYVVKEKRKPKKEIVEVVVDTKINETKTNETTEATISAVGEEKETKKDKNWSKYVFILILLIIIYFASYFYIKYGFGNKNKFNRGWKLR